MRGNIQKQKNLPNITSSFVEVSDKEYDYLKQNRFPIPQVAKQKREYNKNLKRVIGETILGRLIRRMS